MGCVCSASYSQSSCTGGPKLQLGLSEMAGGYSRMLRLENETVRCKLPSLAIFFDIPVPIDEIFFSEGFLVIAFTVNGLENAPPLGDELVEVRSVRGSECARSLGLSLEKVGVSLPIDFSDDCDHSRSGHGETSSMTCPNMLRFCDAVTATGRSMTATGDEFSFVSLTIPQDSPRKKCSNLVIATRRFSSSSTSVVASEAC
mmetsp:Transcript_71496/g.140374  ORF Transcript_71496/g.140374 Transcript_71496/m.140374 type:complete len:201 (-) Transcript_71496:345-947(-)